MKKNIVFAVLALLLAAAAFAQTEADFTVELTKDSEGVKITKYTGKATAVRIPATIQGMPVREIGTNVFVRIKTITSAVIPEGVTSIGEQAFWGCENLTSVNFPKTLTSIGLKGFAETKLTAVDLSGTSITMIGKEAFASCKNLKTIVLPTTIGDLTLTAESSANYDKPAHNSNRSGVQRGIEERAFINCPALTAVTIPEGVKVIEIGKEAFLHCTTLTDLTIPETVERIYVGFYAFQNTKLPLATQAKLKEAGYTGSF
jgi:hypothetical protein